jgi:ubiquinone/menaquinone biosynthesis C-methylase UbiE
MGCGIMDAKVCPWYVGYLLANPLRRLVQDPIPILSPFVKEGMFVLEIGPGMGFFSIPMGRLVGARGRVVCVDVQERMIKALGRRVAKAGLGTIVETRLCTGTSLQIDDLAGKVDFALAFAVVHEVPDQNHLFEEVHHSLKRAGVLLLSEPHGHVTGEEFGRTIATAEQRGFRVLDSLNIRRSHAVTMGMA